MAVEDLYFDYGKPTLSEQRHLYDALDWVVIAGRNPQRLHIPRDPDSDDREDAVPECDGHYGGGFTKLRRAPTAAYPWDDETGPYYPFCQKCVYMWRAGETDI